MASESSILSIIEENARALAQAEANLQVGSKHFLQQLEEHLKRDVDASRTRCEEELQQAASDYSAVSAAVENQLKDLTTALGSSAAVWTDPVWNDHELALDGTIPPATRLGAFHEVNQWEKISFPAMVPILGAGNLLIEARGEAKELAVQALQSIMLRLLVTVPPGKLRFLLLDPVGLGQNVAGFMRLEETNADLVGPRAWTEPTHIEQRLADISEHMETVIQKYLQNRYEDMEAYNREAGEVAEPYRVVVAMNFPANFTENAAKRLISIASNGARCGVHVLATVDMEQPLPYGFSLSELERFSHVVTQRGNRFVWRDEVFESCHLTLDTPPDKSLFDHFIESVGTAASDASAVRVPFDRIVTGNDNWWQFQNDDEILAPLGRAGASRIQSLTLGRGTAQHALIAGKTGSGKSTLLHVIITSLACRYSPDELQLYLVDFKKGVEFKEYATRNLPHARVIAVESEREFGISVLQGLDAELRSRGEQFRQQGVNGIAEYRRLTGSHLPRIILIVDEFQEFFSEDDALADQASLLLDRLVRQGRAFGIHVLLGSQTLAGTYSLARSTIDQMAVRIALQCSDADSRLILSDENDAARLLSRPGEALYNDQNGLYEGNQLFQVAWLPESERRSYLNSIAHLAQEKDFRRSQSLIVFEGNEPADIKKNGELHRLLKARSGVDPKKAKAWLGEPIAIKESTAALLRRQAGSNLLIIGQNEQTAVGILASAFVGLLAQYDLDGPAKYYHLDFTSPDHTWAGIVPKLNGLNSQNSKMGRRREMDSIVADIYKTVLSRLDDAEWHGSTVYFFIWGLQRARDLRYDDEALYGSYSSGWDDEPDAEPHVSTAQKFATIVRDGPDVGVHVLTWCDSYANLARSLQRQDIREFDTRIVFQMNSDDSTNLIDTPAASRLGPNRAFLYDQYTGQIEKFRPYGLPEPDWLHEVQIALHQSLHDRRVQ